MTSKGPNHALCRSQVLPVSLGSPPSLLSCENPEGGKLVCNKCHAHSFPTLTKSPTRTRYGATQDMWVDGDCLSFKISSYHTEAEKKECSCHWDKTCPKGKVVLKILSLPNTEKTSRKLVAVQACLQACMVSSRICHQGIYHLLPTLSESRGVINCSSNANSVNHSDLLSTTQVI